MPYNQGKGKNKAQWKFNRGFRCRDSQMKTKRSLIYQSYCLLTKLPKRFCHHKCKGNGSSCSDGIFFFLLEKKSLKSFLSQSMMWLRTNFCELDALVQELDVGGAVESICLLLQLLLVVNTAMETWGFSVGWFQGPVTSSQVLWEWQQRWWSIVYIFVFNSTVPEVTCPREWLKGLQKSQQLQKLRSTWDLQNERHVLNLG